VVDNGSIDGTREYIKELKETGSVWKYVFNNENMPLARALTEGFKEVESDLFVTVADDMIAPSRAVGPCWLEVFVTKINSDDNIGCINFVGARCSYDKFIKRYD
jgi:GT2 family glycosyltransferase